MQVIYLVPFVLLSGVCGVVCLTVPRWRRYVAGALIAPIAFAGCSLVGLFIMILLADEFGFGQMMGLNRSLDSTNWRGLITFVILYFGPGAMGAVVAALVGNRLQRWTLNRLGF